MKNINFSPLSRIGFNKGFRKSALFLLGGLILLGFFIIVLWHKPIDFYQDQIFDKESTKQSGHICPDLPTKPQNQELIDEKSATIEKTVTQTREGDIEAQENNTHIQETEIQDADILDLEDNIRAKAKFEDNKEQTATGYYLKVFSGMIKRDAEKVFDYLTQMHFLPRLVRESGIALMNNVYVRPDSSLNLEEMLARLKKDGFFWYVQENPKDHYSIRISSCYYLESAKNILEKLKLKGYSGTIMQENTPVKLHSIFLGPYPDLPAVLREQKQLMLRGFPTVIITADFPFFNQITQQKTMSEVLIDEGRGFCKN